MQRSETFEDLRSGAPSCPDETCPIINPIQKSLERLQSDIADLIETYANDYVTGDSSNLEDVRTANSQLRDLAYFWRCKAKDLSFTVDELNERIASFEEESETSKSTIEILRKELSEAHDQCVQAESSRDSLLQRNAELMERIAALEARQLPVPVGVAA